MAETRRFVEVVDFVQQTIFELSAVVRAARQGVALCVGLVLSAWCVAAAKFPLRTADATERSRLLCQCWFEHASFNATWRARVMT